ncbi:MAG: hypothetical protein ACTSU4_00270 [Promethearchaeota archaeon]
MSDPKNNKMILELVVCSKCGNPYMKKKDEEEKELICENCIKLEERKRKLAIEVFDNVIEVENEMEKCINEMKNQLNIAKAQFNKKYFLENIKKRSQTLLKSIELIEKINETNDEKYLEEYKKLFLEKLKKK